jgi:hypothetical protein
MNISRTTILKLLWRQSGLLGHNKNHIGINQFSYNSQ